MRRSLVCRILRGPLSNGATWAREVDAIPEHLDLRVHDRIALDEIELYGEVLSAVAGADRPLTAEQLDEVLGLRPAAQSAD
jgi:hypothetical protein